MRRTLQDRQPDEAEHDHGAEHREDFHFEAGEVKGHGEKARARDQRPSGCRRAKISFNTGSLAISVQLRLLETRTNS